VNERWLDRLRPWAYSSGFGWQIGTGVATYVMTDAIYSLIAVSILLLPPMSALGVGIVFGVTRGASLLIGSLVTTPASLRAIHARLARLASWSIAAPTGAQVAVLLYLAVGTGQAAVIVVGAVAGGMLASAVLRRSHADASLTVAVS
jgi:hypothetical protein